MPQVKPIYSFSHLLTIIFIISYCYGGVYTFRGSVEDSETGNEIAGANVFIVGTNTGTVSDEYGYYSLSWSGDLPVNIRVTYIGYKEYEQQLIDENPLTVRLVPVVLEGQEVDVSSSLSISGNEIESALEKISVRKIGVRGIRDIAEVMQEMAAVDIATSGSGAQHVSIRGSNFNEVSVYLDGMKINRTSDGVANLGSIDLSGLNSIEVIRGGASTLFGSGNFGGVVLMNSNDIVKNSAELKRTVGLSDEKDQDLSAALTLKIGPVGLSGRSSGRSRLYDGRTLYTSMFTNLNAGLTLRRSRTALRYLGSQNYIKFPSGSVRSGDEMSVSQFEYSGSMLKNPGWNIQAGERMWMSEDSFYSNISRNLVDKSMSWRVNKTFNYKLFSSTVQVEEEFQHYSGDHLLLDSYTTDSWKDTATLSQKERGYAVVAHYQAKNVSSTVNRFKLEAGLRRSGLLYDHEQVVHHFRDGSPQDTLGYKFDGKSGLSTFRLGSTVEWDFGSYDLTIFFNQGFNQRAPTLNDRALWGSGLEQSARYARELKLTRPASPQHRALLDRQIAELENIIIAMEDGLENEYVTTTEIHGDIVFNTATSAVNRLDIGGGVFRNYYMNKISYKDIPGNLSVPYNVINSYINGFELKWKVIAWGDLVNFGGNFTKMFLSDSNVFPNRPAERANLSVTLKKYMFSLNLAHIYHGPQNYLRSGVELTSLDSQHMTNITLAAVYRLWKFDFECSYSIRNVFSSDIAEFIPGQDTFEYYNYQRQLLSLKINLTDQN